MKTYKARWASGLAAMAVAATTFAPVNVNVSHAQGNSRTFPETDHTVSGRFLEYWDSHGGLAQQGYPISEQHQETSDTDGKTYTVQYFERAVFELHPENQPPSDVLLSLLGVFMLNQNYPSGAPIALDAGGRYYPETQKHIAEPFLSYWDTHGGLAQQGYPISERFMEKSDLDGKTYEVQYFERAVFELHPENAPPYNVLLSQLGTFRQKQKQTPPTPPTLPTPTQAPATSTPVAPTATPTTAPPPSGSPQPCDTSRTRNGSASPTSGKPGDTITFRGTGFRPREAVHYWLERPSGEVGTYHPVPGGAGPDGIVVFPLAVDSDLVSQGVGRWVLVFRGESSNHQSMIYFCLSW